MATLAAIPAAVVIVLAKGTGERQDEHERK
jgi:hypothetical protein